MNSARAESPAVPHALNVPTRLFGPLTIPLEACYDFPLGLPGFPDLRTFGLLAAAPSGLHWLQSVEEPALAFLLTPTDRLVPDFDRRAAKAGPADLLFAIVTLPSTRGAPATANLQAPLLLDPVERTARQCILERSPWGFHHPVPLAFLAGSSSSSSPTR